MLLLEAVRRSGAKTRFYQASSSEMFGSAPPPQSETTVFQPRSPYAAAKVYAHWMTRIYREGYHLHAANGILFNHESPRRGETFVTRKTTRAVAAILAGREDSLYLGTVDARRDWGYAPEYVEAMWHILQQDAADDYVIGTGETHSVREFVEAAFAYAGLAWQKHVKMSERYFRPLEVDVLVADPSKARTKLGWQPRIGFEDLVAIMVEAAACSERSLWRNCARSAAGKLPCRAAASTTSAKSLKRCGFIRMRARTSSFIWRRWSAASAPTAPIQGFSSMTMQRWGCTPSRRRASWELKSLFAWEPFVLTPSSRRCPSRKRISGTAIRKRPTRHTPCPKKCSSCSCTLTDSTM